MYQIIHNAILMRIAIDARSLEGNKTGVGRYLENLLRVWADKKDCEFILYFKDDIPKRNFLDSEAFTLKKLENPLGFSSNFFFQHILLPYSLKKDSADFFFSPFYLRPFFCPVRSAIVLHDISYEAHPEWFDSKSQFILRTLSKFSARRADIIFTVSGYSKSEITRYYDIDPDKIIVTPLAPDSGFRLEEDVEKIRKIKGKYGLGRFVFCVGTFFTRRHIPEIIEAFDRFSEKDGSYQLCLVGKNKTFPFVDIDKMVNDVNEKFRARKIVHTDFLEEDELKALYSSCAAVVYLSDYEGFGLPVVEAQFFDKPVISSNNTSLVEVGGGSVEFVEENRAEDIAEAFRRVLGDNDYRELLIAKGKENIKRFSWSKCADEILSSILKNV